MSVTLPPFQVLVDTHWREVAGLAHALAGPNDGDDVAQQAWTQALAAYPGVTSARNLRSWLLTITARCATDVHRVRARSPIPVDVTSTADTAGSVGQVGQRADLADAIEPPDSVLWQRVQALPDRQRTAIILRYVLDFDHRSVAAAMGTTPAATRRLVSDALAVLRSARSVIDGGS